MPQPFPQDLFSGCLTILINLALIGFGVFLGWLFFA